MVVSALTQATSIALASTVGAFALAVAVPAVVPPDESVARRSFVIHWLAMVPLLLVPAVFAVFGLGEPILELVISDGTIDGIGVEIAASGLLGALASTPAIVACLSTYQLHAAWTGSSIPLGRFVRRFLRATAFVGLLFGSVLAGFVLLVAFDHPIVYLVLPVVAGLGFKLLLPTLFERQTSVREPREAEHEAIEAATAISGGDPERVAVVEERPEDEMWRPFGRGIGPTARVYVPDHAFEELEPAMLETMLVQLTTRSWFGAVRVTIRGLSAGLLLVALFSLGIVEYLAGGPLPAAGTLAMLASAGLIPAGYLLGKRLVFRQDDRVATVVGADSVVASLRHQDELRGGAEADVSTRLVLMVPTNDERIERQLADGTDGS